MNQQTHWPRVNKAHPCPICGKDHACKVSPDGAVCMCKRIEQGAFKQSKGWYFHRLIEKPQPDNGQHRDPPPTRARGPQRTFATAQAAIEAAGKSVDGGELATVWSYHSADAQEVMRMARFNCGDGEKQFRPVHKAKIGWKIGDPPGLLPLYRLPTLAAEPMIFITEGEKAADALAGLRPGLVVTTSAHGASSAEKSDWSSVKGKRLVILPDNDEPGAKYAQAVARLAMKAGAAGVKIVMLPDLPPGGDAVEFIGAGGTAEKLVELVDAQPWMSRADVLGGVVTRRLDSVVAETVQWLWRDHFALGKLSIIGGVPGVGKSWVTLFIAAAESKGLLWPDGSGAAPLGSVLIANAEDGVADTLKPRLLAMGADCSKIHVLDCVKTPGPDGRLVERGFTLGDVAALEAEAERIEDLRAIIIDPVSAHMGDADEHRNAEVRGLLKPLSRLAAKIGAALILVTHLTKGGGANSVHRMIGSIGFAGAARSVWMISKDPDAPDRRLMLCAKNNIARDTSGLAFTIVDGRIAFEPEPIKQTADEFLRQTESAGHGPAPESRKAAEVWLKDVLKDGPVQSGDKDDPKPGTIRALAKAADMSFGTVRRAADRLGVRREKCTYSGAWQWRLPQGVQCP